MAQSLQFAAVDTSFLVNLAVGDPDCQAVMDFMAAIGVYPIATPSVQAALWDACDKGDAEESAAARNAIEQMPTLGILGDGMDDLQLDLARLSASFVQERLGLPYTESLVLVEAGVVGAHLFVTDYEGFITADNKQLALMLLSRGFSQYPICSVTYLSGLWEYFQNTRRGPWR